ncbi:hypothetical protein GNF10_10460 [Nostoc sp. UCD121]|uniref:hypothetical protein n=1 Tax=unclassified Nostoc TaxID=2593658 RepID=UPI0016274385|nr:MULTISPECIES: hypothetical protein [unclassified Nostoc]MBC1222572.1 hypothetical protein [Nostoc sp. UCD120]MBC1276402.1 hypothetical protein [Nostoc sp. UCD121]MBC1297053.1 hypothetical protein [Nostoc sp. UCD122]
MNTHKIKFKGDKKGYCNICGKYSQLTRDHIPPQGCVKPTLVELRTLTQHISESSKNSTDSQSGLNILSICGDCNNNLLGAQYDPELIELSKKVAGMVRIQQELGLSLPEKINLSVKPQKLIRSLIGHILAGKLPIIGKPPISAPFPDALRNYFLDQSSNIPDNLDIYYWIYPSNKQIVINSLAIGSSLGEGFISGSCLLKFFPLAFWVVWNQPTSFPINLPKIPQSQVKDLDETCEIMIDLRQIPRLNYPEVPGEGRYIMYCDHSTFLAQPKKTKGFG